jgi:predicted GNAT family N-acyltransferase
MDYHKVLAFSTKMSIRWWLSRVLTLLGRRRVYALILNSVIVAISYTTRLGKYSDNTKQYDYGQFVRTDFSLMGLGSKILGCTEDFERTKHEASVFYIQVNPDNQLRSYYGRYGFVFTGETVKKRRLGRKYSVEIARKQLTANIHDERDFRMDLLMKTYLTLRRVFTGE